MSGPYQVRFAPSANREFRKLPRKVQAVLASRVDSLAADPRPPGAKQLAGPHELWRLREGDYRMIYQIRDEVLFVLVVRVGHRGEVYRRLDRLEKALRR
jgi:mRNA interferase RelE/StbE